MSFRKTTVPCSLIALALALPAVWGQDPSLTIDVAHPGAKISPSLYGIFFEEIDHAGDGGIYAELIRDRTFEERTADVVVMAAYAPLFFHVEDRLAGESDRLRQRR